MKSTAEKRRYAFLQLDVFTSRPLEGNPLAVFLDARGLSSAQMQAIAKEMNLAETTFILPGEERTPGTHRVRIFTIQEELPFAGHPTLGTAMVLREKTGSSEVTLDLNVGQVPVTFSERGDGVFGEMRQRDPDFGPVFHRDDVARAIGISSREIADDVPIQTVSTGLAFTIVPLRSLSFASQLRIDAARATEYLEKSGGKFFYFVTRETVNPEARLHARMMFYGGEDPATGSAAGCCTAWAVRYNVIPPDQQALIEQGVEMGRRSHIYVRASGAGDQVSNVRVGGHAVEVVRGELQL